MILRLASTPSEQRLDLSPNLPSFLLPRFILNWCGTNRRVTSERILVVGNHAFWLALPQQKVR